MSYQIIGTCSICGGAVVVPTVWLCIDPPIPRCRNCGATSAQPYGPVIPMEPSEFPRWLYCMKRKPHA